MMALLLFTFISAMSMHAAAEGSQAPRPNIVFVMADDLGYSDIGYHSKEAYTPTLDRLAREGVTLENYYVQPICAPTRSTFLSGRLPIHTGFQHRNLLRTQPSGLPLDSLTLADKLKEAGYNTDMVGKWHLGYYKPEYLPTNRGFNTFYGIYLGGSNYYSHKACNRGSCYLDLHNDTRDSFRPDFNKSGVYATYLYTREAVRIIENRAKESSPFFLFLSHQAVHSPLQVPLRYSNKIRQRLMRLKQKAECPEQKCYRPSRKNNNRLRLLSQALSLDESVEQVVSALKKSGAWNNTVFIFSTDNGGSHKFGSSNFPLRGYKRDYYEGGVRGVAFVNSPLLKNSGNVSQGLMHVSDWFPTFMALANGSFEGTKNVNGFNQWETLSLGAPSPRDDILFNIDPLTTYKKKMASSNNGFDTRVLAAYRKGDYKIITGLKNEVGFSLFNLKEDPYEQNDLASDPEFKDKVNELLGGLASFNKTSVPVVYPPVVNIKLTNGVWGPWK